MCGIVGQVIKMGKVDIGNFDKMRDTLTHRGPDGYGRHIMENGRVALGHRRLSIIDLSENGKQPMTNEDETVWITFNGEIYNFQELKKILLDFGHKFRSNCDTEVIVHGYEQWGTQVFSKLKGMFALGIYDEKKKKIVLARDRFGIKPLYYCWQNNNFIFASELKAIVRANDFIKNIDWTSVLDFFVYRFIPTPKTIYKDVWKLEPASYLEINIDEKPGVPIHYWNLVSNELDVSLENVVSTFDMMMERSVQEHLLSDVPLGVFLSGGYDSTAMVYYMDKLKFPIQSFSIGFKDWLKSEHEDARTVANIFGTTHTEKLLTEEKIDSVEMLSYYYDEPQGGTSFLPTFEVNRLASNKVKVVISGDGGDELLGGYSWHKNILAYNGSSNILHQIKKTLAPDFLEQKYHENLSWTKLTYSETNRLFNKRIAINDLPDDLWVYKKKKIKGEDTLKALQRLDINTFLLDVFLPKVDRASMANSVEVRVPFLDHSLMEYMFSIPSSRYFDKNVNKIILNTILKRRLPSEILNKPKQGFGSPFSKSYEIHEIIKKVSEGNLVKENIINVEMLNQYVREKSLHKLWALYIFENWFTRWN